MKQSLVDAPVLALPDADKPFSVVCDASNFAIGSALMQKDDDGVDRVISYQSRLLKAAEQEVRYWFSLLSIILAILIQVISEP